MINNPKHERIKRKKISSNIFPPNYTIRSRLQVTSLMDLYLLDHWNSISKFRDGPLLLSGNSVYSPATAPSITTRSIWIVTFPNELCHQIKGQWVKMQFKDNRK